MTKTITVSDNKVRATLGTIRQHGGFVVSSTMVANGYQIVYRADPR